MCVSQNVKFGEHSSLRWSGSHIEFVLSWLPSCQYHKLVFVPTVCSYWISVSVGHMICFVCVWVMGKLLLLVHIYCDSNKTIERCVGYFCTFRSIQYMFFKIVYGYPLSRCPKISNFGYVVPEITKNAQPELYLYFNNKNSLAALEKMPHTFRFLSPGMTA